MKIQTFKLINKAYETPVCSVMELYMEGVLCVSGQHEGISRDGDENDSIFDF